mmetsp:Transcript_8781/g.21692  ORF Transcript_8781/g.21692 Transcript_8781/m.21692 type:complete len:260 (+) Transcript_8781:1301-2080(+)
MTSSRAWRVWSSGRSWRCCSPTSSSQSSRSQAGSQRKATRSSRSAWRWALTSQQISSQWRHWTTRGSSCSSRTTGSLKWTRPTRHPLQSCLQCRTSWATSANSSDHACARPSPPLHLTTSTGHPPRSFARLSLASTRRGKCAANSSSRRTMSPSSTSTSRRSSQSTSRRATRCRSLCTWRLRSPPSRRRPPPGTRGSVTTRPREGVWSASASSMRCRRSESACHSSRCRQRVRPSRRLGRRSRKLARVQSRPSLKPRPR